MPMMDDVYGGNALKADEMPPNFRAVLTVERVSCQSFADRDNKSEKERKLVLYFHGKEKGLVLNVTNANMMAEIANSRDYDYWPGHKVLLYRTMVEFGGKRVPGLRLDHVPSEVLKPSTPPVPPPPPPSAPRPDGSVDDSEIPFAVVLPLLAGLVGLGTFIA